MIKFNKIMLIGLSCLSFNMYSGVGQKMMDGIRQSNISIVEAEIASNKITQEEAKGLLEIAKQVEDIKKSRIGKAPRKTKILVWLMKKLRLFSVTGTALGTAFFTACGVNIIFGNGEGDKELAKSLTPIIGVVSALSSIYAVYLFKKIKKFKSKQDQYHEAIAVRQILERVSSDKQV